MRRAAPTSRAPDRDGRGARTQLLFFALELAELDDDVAEKLLADEALERWAHWLRSERKFRRTCSPSRRRRSSPRSRCRA